MTLVAALEVVVAKAAVAGHVDAEDEQVALPLESGVDDGFDDGHGDAHGDAWTFSSISSSKPSRRR